MPLSSQWRRDRLALHIVQLGAIGVVLASAPYKAFDLDRFFVPKELVLHACAAIAALLVLSRCRRFVLTRVDLLLVAFLGLSALSALFATNWWIATRALALSYSGILLYWVASALRREGLVRPLLRAAVAAAVIGTLTALIQAYAGTTTDYFSLNRAPGGTFGNRNFMAHLATIAAPVLILMTLSARRTFGFWCGTCGTLVLAAGLVLSRSRAAWLSLAVALVVVAIVAVLTRARIGDGNVRRRLVGIVLAAAVGVACAILIPNRLEWTSASPYLDSVRDVVNYHEGSGRGRIVQYTHSLSLATAHPVFGVGPGNWAVDYPKVAARGDPSLASDEGMTDNPWPSSDWIAFVSERGVLATACIGLAILGLFMRGIADLRRPLAEEDRERTMMSLALVGTIVATVVVGAFDAVLLIAVPTMFLWILAGALAPPGEGRIPVERGIPGAALVIVAVLGLGAVGRSVFQLAAMSVETSSTRLSAIEKAARLDPGSYRLQLRAAQAHLARKECAKALPFARAAHGLYPSAADPRRYLKECGG